LPTQEEAAAAGFEPEDYASDPVDIWPDTYWAYEAMNAMATQWRMGMNGPTGLDYSAIPMVLRMIGAPRSEWQQLYSDLRVMEAAALGAMNKRE